MATSIGKLAVYLTANTAGLVKGLGVGVRSLVGFATGLPGKLAAVSGAIGGFTVTRFIKNSFEAADAAGDMADRLGMSVTRLTELQHAANLADVEQESLTTGLGFLTRRIGDATSGGKEAKEAFDAIGVSAAQLAEMDLGDAFAKVAEGISQLHPAQQAFAASQIFGRGAVSLLPMLRGGKVALKEAAEEARRFGLSMSELDAGQVDVADRSWKQIKATLLGLGRQIAIQVSPFVFALAQEFLGASDSGTTMAERVVNGVEKVATVFSFLIDVVNLVKLAWKALELGITGGLMLIARGVTELLKFINDLDIGIGEMRLQFDAEAAERFTKSLEDDLKGVQDEIRELRKTPSGREQVANFFEGIRQRAREAAEAMQRAQGAPVPIPVAGPRETKLPEALIKGSKEAFSAVTKSQFRDSMQERMVKGVEKAAGEAEKIRRGMEDRDEIEPVDF